MFAYELCAGRFEPGCHQGPHENRIQFGRRRSDEHRPQRHFRTSRRPGHLHSQSQRNDPLPAPLSRSVPEIRHTTAQRSSLLRTTR